MKAYCIIFFIGMIVCLSCNNKLKEIEKKFGEGYNAGREQLHLVKTEPGKKWIDGGTPDDRRFIYVFNHDTEMKAPGYLHKTIMLDSSGQRISYEQDEFKNPADGFYLEVMHEYYSGKTSIGLQTAAPNAAAGSTALSNAQADSVLKAWKVKPNPFQQ